MGRRLFVVIAAVWFVLGGTPATADGSGPRPARSFRADPAPVPVPALEIFWIACEVDDVGDDFVVAATLSDDQGGSAFNWLSGDGLQASVQVLTETVSWRPQLDLPRIEWERIAWGNGSEHARDVRGAWAIFGTDGACRTSVGPEPTFPSEAGADTSLVVDPSRARLAYLTDLTGGIAARVVPFGGITTGGSVEAPADGWFSGIVDMTSSVGSGGRVVATGPDGRRHEARGALAINERESHGTWRFDVVGPQLRSGPLLVTLDVPSV